MNILLKDGSSLSLADGTNCLDAAREISSGLANAALAARVNGHVRDLSYQLSDGDSLELLTFDSDDGKRVFRHTASHILAQAVKRLYPDAKLTIGPATDTGFYYDFDYDPSFNAESLEKISAEMKKIVKEALRVERFSLPRDEALAFMRERNEPYKLELIEALPEGKEISFYRQGEFVDLCAGAHLLNTSKIKAFALTSCTGAYWRGDSDNKMLRRIYGTAFPKASELTEYLEAVEEAKRRDHNKLGRELEFFTTSELIGQGLPIMLPRGARIIQTLQRFVEDEEEKRGYLLTKTPFMAKRELYKVSGHWDHYREGMFIMGDPDAEGEVFALRPMTCPFQFMTYLAKPRSYRDLPMRLAETSTLFRNEASGEMHGLIRVRQFTISEGHLACTPDQLESEFFGCVDLARYILDTLGLAEDVTYRFSKWDENDRDKYIGTPEQWNEVQGRMRDILNDLKIDYTEADGEAAFYGPKLDVQIKNVHGKEDTLVTIQVDFLLAERFGMEYVDADGEKKYPYVLHRTSLGCYERTLALLIEKYAGALPTWLMPTQVKILPITDRLHDYAKEIETSLRNAGIRTETDFRSEKIGYKIREAQLEKVPYMLVLGDKELEEKTVTVRARKNGENLGAMTLDAFIARVRKEIDTRAK